jgi:uncharacterized protein YebE (UPF0316 family)
MYLFIFLQLIGIIIILTWKDYKSITASVAVFEVIVFVGQIMKMKTNVRF